MRPVRLAPAVALLFGACSGNGAGRSVVAPTPNANARAAAIAIDAGDRQQGRAGEPLGSALAVRVTDSAGKPLSNVRVTFSVSAGSAGLVDLGSPSGIITATPSGPATFSAFSNDAGIAEAMLEPFEVGRISVTASVAGSQISPVTFSADAEGVLIVFRSMGGTYGDYAGFYGPCRCSGAVNTVTVPVGTTIEWKSRDAYPYSVTTTSTPASGPSFDSGILTTNSAFRFVPQVAGTWHYRDSISGIAATLVAK